MCNVDTTPSTNVCYFSNILKCKRTRECKHERKNWNEIKPLLHAFSTRRYVSTEHWWHIIDLYPHETISLNDYMSTRARWFRLLAVAGTRWWDGSHMPSNQMFYRDSWHGFLLYIPLPFCTLSFVEKGFFCILKVNGKIPSECVFVWKDVVTHWLKMNDNIRMTLNVARSLIVLYTFFEFIPSTYKRVPWAMSTHHIVCTSELNFQST